MKCTQIGACLLLALSLCIACGEDIASPDSYVTDCSILLSDIDGARDALKAAREPGCANGCPTTEEVLQLLAKSSGCPAISLASASDETPVNGVPRVRSTGSGVIEPDGATGLTSYIGAPSVGLYIESSASMYGYLKGKDLKTKLGDVILALSSKQQPIASEVKLGYLQKSTKLFTGSPLAFPGTLTETTLENAGSGSSDISELVKRTLDASGNGVAVLISDFVFSPGKYTDAADFLAQERQELQSLIDVRLGADDQLAIALIAVEAQDFDGIYYDHNDSKFDYAGPRPYYYFVGGRNPGVRAVAEAIERATGGTAITFAKGGMRIDYAIGKSDRSSGVGTYEIGGQPNEAIVSSAAAARGGSTRGILHVPIAVNLSSLALTEAQLLNANTISVSGKWTVATVEAIGTQRPPPPYTHTLTLEYAGDPYPAEVEVSFPAGTTASLSQRYFAPGALDEGDPSAFGGQTYGLRQLVQGISDAYAKTSTPGTPSGSFTFKIEK